MEKTSQKVQETREQSDKVQNIRVNSQTREVLAEILNKVNGKEHGRNIKADDLIAIALSLITPKEIKELQEASLSNADRLELGYQKYVTENSYISKDEYLGHLMNGELRL